MKFIFNLFRRVSVSDTLREIAEIQRQAMEERRRLRAKLQAEAMEKYAEMFLFQRTKADAATKAEPTPTHGQSELLLPPPP